MPAYTNIAAILGNIQMSDLIPLTDDDQTGELNETVLNQVISNAGEFIDAAIGNIYQTPVTSGAAPIPSWALTVTCFMLYRRRMVPDERNNFNADYVRVSELLDKVNDGRYRLSIPLVRDFSQVAVNSQPTIFGAGNALANTM